MNSITKQTTIIVGACARNVSASNLLRRSAQTMAMLLLLSGIPATGADKLTVSKASKSGDAKAKATQSKDSSDSKTLQSSAGGEGWMQDKAKAEKLLHMTDASGSVYLAAKLSTADDLKTAHQLLRKSAQELSNQPSHPKAVIGEQLGKLIADFAFLQSIASLPVKQAANAAPTTVQNLKDVCADYDALIPAAEKQLGSGDLQVRSLKTLRSTFNQALDAQKKHK